MENFKEEFEKLVYDYFREFHILKYEGKNCPFVIDGEKGLERGLEFFAFTDGDDWPSAKGGVVNLICFPTTGEVEGSLSLGYPLSRKEEFRSKKEGEKIERYEYAKGAIELESGLVIIFSKWSDELRKAKPKNEVDQMTIFDFLKGDEK